MSYLETILIKFSIKTSFINRQSCFLDIFTHLLYIYYLLTKVYEFILDLESFMKYSFDVKDGIKIEWMLGAQTNIAYNCLGTYYAISTFSLKPRCRGHDK